MAAWVKWIPALLGGVSDWFKRKHELRMKKLDLKYKVEEAKALAEINYQQTKLEGEINWELESIKNSGWKDDWLTMFTSALIAACFIPVLQPYTLEGFDILGMTPLWFQALVAVMYSSAFGVRYFGKYTQFVTAKKQAEVKMAAKNE